MTSQPSETLNIALRNLAQAWDTARPKWKDANAEQFERHHLQPLLAAIAQARKDFARCETSLDGIERKCP